MTQAEILESQIMQKFWGRLCDLSDSDLMKLRQMEMELQHSIKEINAEMNRRIRND